MKRRDFLGAGAAAGLLAACGPRAAPPLPPGELTGPDLTLGHRLARADFPAPTETRRVAVLIAGGGIGGLSAGWKLARAGFEDFLVLDLEREPGGNSRAGRNEVTAYPLGAHYLPLPPREASAVRELLRELGALHGRGDRIGDYDERYLCHAPQERLYRDGWWQEGLWPIHGVPAAERDQYRRFQDFVGGLRRRRGGRPFALPLARSSRDPRWLALDRLNFRDWLLGEGYTAPGLHWLADYACRDDYGTRAADTSAWAGLHYFACREDEGGIGGAVLTTPGGNAWLASGLAAAVGRARTLTKALAYRVEERPREVGCTVFLAAENRSVRIVARELIWAAPLFLVPRVFANPRPEWLAAARAAEYAPWVVASLQLAEWPHTRAGAPLAWDNVIEDSAGLGYVVATHQALRYAPGPTTISWYRALHEESAPAGRLIGRDRDAWARDILDDLERPHPEIREIVSRLDVHRHAHAMIRPRPGRLWSAARLAIESPPGRIRFAHADASGLSLFEEANYRGVRAAEEVLRRLGMPFRSSLG